MSMKLSFLMFYKCPLLQTIEPTAVLFYLDILFRLKIGAYLFVAAFLVASLFFSLCLEIDCSDN